MTKTRRLQEWRRVAAVSAGKISGTTSRLLGKGGGTALPGLVAIRLDPDLLRHLSRQLGHDTVVVSGTNGKTTTARILTGILQRAGYAVIKNESGSNLLRGIAASLVRESNFRGNLSKDVHRLGVFEVDEAALPLVLEAVPTGMVLLLDLFRDQLDRYGEVATVARLWLRSLQRLPASARILANSDDPLVAEVVAGAKRPALFFGLEGEGGAAIGLDHASDVKACPRCRGIISYSMVYLSHLGHYSCTACDFRRPSPTVYANEVTVLGIEGSRFILNTPQDSVEIFLAVPGLYNVYNAVAAAAAAFSLGIGTDAIGRAIGAATAAFGRMERIEVQGRTIFLALAKNPTGLNEVLRTLVSTPGMLHLLVMLNDNTADGRDVSWIWDAEIELLHARVASAVFSGGRAEDMALRFKYADIDSSTSGRDFAIEHSAAEAFDRALAMTPEGATLFIVPTYTAMLEMRHALARRGHIAQYWES